MSPVEKKTLLFASSEEATAVGSRIILSVVDGKRKRFKWQELHEKNPRRGSFTICCGESVLFNI